MTFTSTVNARVQPELKANPLGDRLEVGVNDFAAKMGGFEASGTVAASGPDPSVATYRVGFLQTIFASARRFYYEPVDIPVRRGARIVITDHVNRTPIRDGYSGDSVWFTRPSRFPDRPLAANYDDDDADYRFKDEDGNYEEESETDPDADWTATASVSMIDIPWEYGDWTIDTPLGRQKLVMTDGWDRFTCWLAVRDAESDVVIPLQYVDWEINFGTLVDYDPGSPERSTVTPVADPAARITGQGQDHPRRRPRLDGPIANADTSRTSSTW